MPPPSTSVFTRQRTPLLIAAFLGGSGLFIGLKWRAVLQRSEVAKKASTRDYAVAPGRSAMELEMTQFKALDLVELVETTFNDSMPLQTLPSNVTSPLSPVPNTPSAMNLGPSLPTHPTRSTKPTLLTLPAEIRNKIYEFTWLASRDRDPTYDIPDFTIMLWGFRWKNISSFPLFFVSKQIFSESLPIISSSAYFEIKACINSSSPKSWWVDPVYEVKKNARICGGARKVVVHVSDKKGEEWIREEDLVEIVQELRGMRKLQEVVVRVTTLGVELSDFMMLKSLFLLLKRGIVLVFDLYWMELETIVKKSSFERAISAVAEKVGGKKAEAWIEWTEIENDW